LRTAVVVTPTIPSVGKISDGRDWLENRLEFLEEELARTTDEVTRVAIEAEIDVVMEDLSRLRRIRRRPWIVGFRLPHQQD
jgi:hypothetical protein